MKVKLIPETLVNEAISGLVTHGGMATENTVAQLRALMDADTLRREIDITAPKAVQFQIRRDGKVAWANVDGKCVLRCCQIQEGVDIQDDRKV